MSERRWTPGPWHWVIHDHSMATLQGPAEEMDHVVSISPCASCEGRQKEWQWGTCMTPELADAHLIAAAPDLYEALKALQQDDVIRAVCPSPLWAKMVNAMMKARGEA